MKVMTFNLRMATPNDGENAWSHRKEALAALINEERPVVLGTQEGTPPMLSWLDEQLTAYRRYGVARGGRGQGEHAAIYILDKEVQIVDFGDFWLSDTPHIPGSRSFGNRVVRMATWVRFVPAGGSQEWLACNLHLDHEIEAAREQGALLAWRTMQALSPVGPAMLMGDLNASPSSKPLAFLQGQATIDGDRGDLQDALDIADDTEDADVGTFHGYRGRDGAKHRIDYILVSKRVHVPWAAVLTRPSQGRVVSDHFPVAAEVEDAGSNTDGSR